MKRHPFYRRLGFSIRGIGAAVRSEPSFRTQLGLGAGAVALLFVLRPAPIWWAVFALAIAGVLTAELINTALEHAIDRLHPEMHPMMGVAKDCAAGAVLLASLGSLGVLVAMLFDRLG